MPQTTDRECDHATLFRDPDYQQMFEAKRNAFECPHSQERVQEISDWTKSWDYREKNLARTALVVNPAKACQPLGAVFAAAGFDGCLPLVHGSQGCVAYFRSHLARHFKEPSSAVSTSMTEDAAVFGGHNNFLDGIQNARELYSPKMIAVSTTCMAEVIGDDLNSYIQTARSKGAVPEDFPVPYAHTPSFYGSHVTGYDVMLKGVLEEAWDGIEDAPSPGSAINLIPGFDGYAVGNNRELRRMLDLMGVSYTLLGDVSEVFDTPTDGEFRMYAGGTTLEEVRQARDAKATLSLQQWCTEKTLALPKGVGQETRSFHYPMGVSATDAFLMAVSEITGQPIPEALELERGRLVDAMTDSQHWLHGKRMAVYGDPDFVYGMTRFLLELGIEPVHCLSTNANKKWAKEMRALLAGSSFGQATQVWAGRDLWHLRSLLATEPADFLIGNSHGKSIQQDLGIPLIRLTFPIFDRHHHHRFPTLGYQGGLRVLVTLLDAVLDEVDRKTADNSISYDLTR
ncbi:nitrogenase molybdenum-iron protein subunit beta [Rhodovibrio salinarum]|uniref:Nitrogenase molybdenum-iron protein beta chain n=1 Tax=Rhodovibrio salinarum TaxID=1087 RepID=A0A934QMC6_9PROT|nr:nitrogenase molybdenum-iron protein subunit beta [Rhodovibrio salinarum]MBK1699000.1 nitrogenase molybdenum-iron protein subunit beta [Rhodovibrio salinarum]